MSSKACLKCGHVCEGEDLPDACPMCGAIYARVEAAMARGETIQRAAPAAIAARRERLEILVTERPSLLVSVLIALGFAIALFATLASFGIFGMLLSAPGDGNGAAWQKGFTTFIYTLAVGWAFASGTSLLLSLMRRPVAGLFAGMGLGLTAALVYVFMLR